MGTGNGEKRRTLRVALVPFMPLPIVSPLCTKTQPTGVSSERSASCAYHITQKSANVPASSVIDRDAKERREEKTCGLGRDDRDDRDGGKDGGWRMEDAFTMSMASRIKRSW